MAAIPIKLKSVPEDEVFQICVNCDKGNLLFSFICQISNSSSYYLSCKVKGSVLKCEKAFEKDKVSYVMRICGVRLTAHVNSIDLMIIL